jgi:phage recombination protein Bet
MECAMSDAIMKSDGVGQLAERAWTKERVELVKRTICPKGISDDAFALFMEQCKRSGLDPLLKEAFCVPRRQKVGDSWVEAHVFQPAEAGMLARAERFPDYRGCQASAVYAEDDIIMDQGRGEVTHKFNPAKRKGQLAGAWARVERTGKMPTLVWVDFQGYVQQTPLWSKIPTTMIEKCARVAALRKAYPEAFGGLYIAEEMPEEKPATETRAAKKPPLPPPEDPPALAESNIIEAQFRAASEQVIGMAPEYEEERVVIIGRHKGKSIATLAKEAPQCLVEAIEDAEKIVSEPKNRTKKNYPAASRAHAALLAERDRSAAHVFAPMSEQEKAAIIEQEKRLAEPGTERGC